jgi:hypothetical protein
MLTSRRVELVAYCRRGRLLVVSDVDRPQAPKLGMSISGEARRAHARISAFEKEETMP